jgi:predicted adenine nucleotide alpha hydrolase (AANH) superfamily ATPase
MRREERQIEVRRKYNVPTPSWSTRFKIHEDFCRTTGKTISFMHGETTVMNFWRQNKERYTHLEEEAARQKAFFERRRAEQAARASRLGSLKRRLCVSFIV